MNAYIYIYIYIRFFFTFKITNLIPTQPRMELVLRLPEGKAAGVRSWVLYFRLVIFLSIQAKFWITISSRQRNPCPKSLPIHHLLYFSHVTTRYTTRAAEITSANNERNFACNIAGSKPTLLSLLNSSSALVQSDEHAIASTRKAAWWIW
jgi:hypothetical protein